MSGTTAWSAIGVSGGALVVSFLAMLVAYTSYRASGPRITIVEHGLTAVSDEDWLQVKLANSGRAEIDIDGAWSNWLGTTITSLPIRLQGGSSSELTFRGALPTQYAGPLTVSVGLGNGRTMLKHITLTDNEQGLVNARRFRRPVDTPRVGGVPVGSDQPVTIPTDQI